MVLNPLKVFAATVLAMGSLTANAAIDLPAFQQFAGNNASRCVGGRPVDFCQGELQYALSKDLITQSAYDWGRANEYYPVISRRDTVEAVCKCGCFEQSTQILLIDPESLAESYVAIKDITKTAQVVALRSEATLQNLATKSFAIKDLVSGPEETPLYAFALAGGRTLKLTQHHGAVLANGRVVAAKDVQPGDAFLDAKSGSSTPILAVTREKTKDKVYNFEVAGDDNLNHVIVAEGVFVGDLAWQNRLQTELNAIQIRN